MARIDYTAKWGDSGKIRMDNCTFQKFHGCAGWAGGEVLS